MSCISRFRCIVRTTKGPSDLRLTSCVDKAKNSFAPVAIPRFILNQAGVRPLNMFSLLYPNSYVVKAGCIEHLWVLLNSTFSLSRLHSVSRTYGGNTLKVEPRELDNLPVINPLALPDEIRQRISELINEFYRHRDAPLLIRETDALIDTLLDPKVVAQHQSPLPVQLQLFEPQKNY